MKLMEYSFFPNANCSDSKNISFFLHIRTPKIIVRIILVSMSIVSVFFLSCACEKKINIDIFSTDWSEIQKAARGQTVYFNAWGGSNQINQYLQWIREQVKERYDINLIHVLLQDTMVTVRRLQQEKAASNVNRGSIDILWLNGNAFNVIKNEDLFLGNILDVLPNKVYLDTNNSVLYEDFTVPTEGLEVPWGIAQLGFFYRSEKVKLFNTIEQFEKVIKQYSGTFTYPAPNLDFTGRTFLKNIMYLCTDEKDLAMFYAPYTGTDIQQTLILNNTAWPFLDTMHSYMWKKGSIFPNSYAEMVSLFKDFELHYGITFNPYDALSKVLNGEYSDDVRMFFLDEGTVANAHFLTIPFNSSAKAGAIVVIDFLISPEAQARKSDPQFWGDPTVLDVTRLNEKYQALFTNAASTHPAGPPKNLGKSVIKEFHSTWEIPIQEFWQKRYIEE